MLSGNMNWLNISNINMRILFLSTIGSGDGCLLLVLMLYYINLWLVEGIVFILVFLGSGLILRGLWVVLLPNLINSAFSLGSDCLVLVYIFILNSIEFPFCSCCSTYLRWSSLTFNHFFCDVHEWFWFNKDHHLCNQLITLNGLFCLTFHLLNISLMVRIYLKHSFSLYAWKSCLT